jgi:hypothetical protein
MPRSVIMDQWVTLSLSAVCHRFLPALSYSKGSMRFWAYLKPRSGCVTVNSLFYTAAQHG